MHSKYEPGGRVSIEAMSAALPVIATPCGFAVDTIINWHTGFLVNWKKLFWNIFLCLATSIYLFGHMVAIHKTHLLYLEQIQSEIRKILSKKTEIYEIIRCYQSFVETLEMNSQEDFSIALEANWTLRRANECDMLDVLYD